MPNMPGIVWGIQIEDTVVGTEMLTKEWELCISELIYYNKMGVMWATS